MTGFGLFANATIYFAFMTGIYNFRTYQLVNMRHVPFLAKFAVSTLTAYAMCHKLYEGNIYDPELYRIAIKYRPQFDTEY